MSADPAQLAFDLPHLTAFGAEDFLVSRCNEAAVAVADRWPDWPHPVVALVGPAGSGKSHLVNVWRSRSAALVVQGTALREDVVKRLAGQKALAVEDIDRGISDERILFHLFNMAAEQQLSVLVTTRVPPGELVIALPDLRSRIRAAPVLTITDPDESLVHALLVKLFSDRQLAVEPHVVSYLALRVERSTEALEHIVAEIDRMALATHRKVTRALVADALARQSQGRSEPDE